MNDCVNAEARDRLPELLTGGLADAELFAVARHVDDCADCKAELELLRSARGALLAATPAIDYAAIVDRLPAPSAMPRAGRTAQRWSSWRMAAAASVVALAAVGASFLARGTTPATTTTQAVAVAPVAKAPASATVTAPPVVPAEPVRVASAEMAEPHVTKVASAAHELAVQGDLSDLSAADLQALLDGVNTMDAVPAAEPDLGTAGVTLTGGT